MPEIKIVKISNFNYLSQTEKNIYNVVIGI